VDLLLQRELGLRATLALLESIQSGRLRVVAPTQADLARAAELLRETMEYRPRLTDAVLVATPSAWVSRALPPSTAADRHLPDATRRAWT